MTRSLAELLASFGFTPLTATDGEDAIEKLAAFDADVIVADLVMPRMDGLHNRLAEFAVEESKAASAV